MIKFRLKYKNTDLGCLTETTHDEETCRELIRMGRQLQTHTDFVDKRCDGPVGITQECYDKIFS